MLLITPPYRSSAPSAEAYANAVIAIGQLWNIPVADVYHNAQMNATNFSLYSGDGVHWNSLGAKRGAEVIIGKLKEVEPIFW